MIDSKMLWVTNVNQCVVVTPRVRVNDRFNADAPANNGLKRFLLDIRDNPGKDFTVAFVDAEDNTGQGYDGFSNRFD